MDYLIDLTSLTIPIVQKWYLMAQKIVYNTYITLTQKSQIIYYAFLRRIQKEKKQTHIKNKIIENRQYETFTVNEGDETIYDVQGFDPDIMLPDEDVYKPKKKETKDDPKGLENFMDNDD